MLDPRLLVRNARLLVQSVAQHLFDDPALFTVQVSRRLPMDVRRRVGVGLLGVAASVRRDGLAALGAFMAGDDDAAIRRLNAARGTDSRTAGEVAVLLDRVDLLPTTAPASTRARALWAQGDLSGAVDQLDVAVRSDTAQGRRLRSELDLLRAGRRLRARRLPAEDLSPER